MPPEEPSTRSRSREQLREFRRITANAVGELRSQQVRDTFAALSLEELIDQHIALLSDTDDPMHTSRLQRIDRIHTEFSDNIEAMKATPPDEFRRHDPQSDANTDPAGEETT